MQEQAMHLSDGLLNAPTAGLFGAIALAGLAWAAHKARADLDDRAVPLAGLVAAVIFAAQMVNFPVLPGVSGHLLGGALAALLVGPYAGALCVGLVLVVQALLFADGGLSVLGANITNMALLGTAVGYAVALALRGWARRSRAGLLTTAFLAALANTVAAAVGFSVQYALGGAIGLSVFTATLGAVGVHVLIGIGEGVITAAIVGGIASMRPDLVYLNRRRAVDRAVLVPSS